MKVLIVDDIVMNRILLAEIIGSLGYEYLLAKNGKEAIEILTQNKIDIILMDIEMPVMNGLETTIHIRTKLNKSLKNIPIIALTAHDPNDFFEDFNKVGFNNLLTKPYTISRLSTILAEYQ